MSNTFNNNASEDENFMFDKNKKNSFSAPEGYFDQLSDKIIAKMELEEELKEFKILSAIQKQSAFKVPENYFSENENKLLYRSELAPFNTLRQINKPEYKNSQQAYFESLSAKISAKIELADELKNYAVLYQSEKKNNFPVADEYFETLADKVKERIYSTDHQEKSLINRLLKIILKPKIAFAYSVVLIAVIGLFFYTNRPKPLVESGPCKTLACLEKNELLNEHNVRDFDDDNLYEMVDVDALNKQLSKGAVLADSIAVNKIVDTTKKSK